MGRAPCCKKVGLKKGRWTDEEDNTLIKYIKANGEGSWRSLPKNAGLLRCGKSCRLRWINYLRADLKRGNITEEEEITIVKLHASIGNRWSVIASHLPGRTDNEIKNYWNSHLSRKIYRFYKHGTEPKPPSKNVVKMTSPNKQRAGRVSRSVAKKYNKNSALNVELSRTDPAASDAQNPLKAITIDTMDGSFMPCWFNQQEEESRRIAVDHDSCKESAHLCHAGGAEDKGKEVLDPYNYEEVGQHIAELNCILESGVEDSCGNLRLDMETENPFMGVKEMTVLNAHEMKENVNGDGSSSLSDCNGRVGYPMNSCFHEDEWFDWGLEAGPVGGLTVPWDEGEDMLFSLWDSDIHDLGDCQYH